MNQPDTARVPVPHVVAEDDGGVVAVEVVGPLGRAKFPGLCMKCGVPADRTVALTKLFYHSGNRRSYFFADGVAAPACAGCAGEHGRELRPIAPEVKRRLLRSWAVATLPFIVPVAVIAWMLTMFVPELLEALRGGEPAEVAIWGAVCAFFGVMGLVFVRLILKPGRPMMLTPGHTSPVYAQVERGPLGSRYVAPTEPTSLMRAMDFSGDESELFEPERHRFTFRNYEVAAGFSELNAHRQWDPASRRAQLAATGRRALIGLVVLGVIYALLAEFFL
ncbi:MAG: hypothetical protein AB1941_15370 [Gemmatimonadota bacterium]